MRGVRGGWGGVGGGGGGVPCHGCIPLGWSGSRPDQWSDLRSLGSWCIKGTNGSTLVTDSSVPLMHHDPSDLGSLFLIQIILKERNLWLRVYNVSQRCRKEYTTSLKDVERSIGRVGLFEIVTRFYKLCRFGEGVSDQLGSWVKNKHKQNTWNKRFDRPIKDECRPIFNNIFKTPVPLVDSRDP